MPRFRKKPVEIEAVQWTGSNYTDIADFMNGSPTFGSDGQGAAWVDIPTLEGTMRADKGDWIIREPFPTKHRQFYPCKPDIFEQTYVPAPDGVTDEGREYWL